MTSRSGLRGRRSAASALLTVALLAIPSASARADVTHPPVLIQEGNACLPTAAAMALHSLGDPTTPRDVARRLPFHSDGTDFFDLQEELTRRGYASLVFTAGPDAVAAAIEAGVPVVAAVRRGSVKHAVMVWGVRDGDDGRRVLSIDPADGAEREESFESFEEAQYAGQLLALWRQDTPAESVLEAAEFPLDAARRTNARFRAAALVRRAERHPEPNRQALELLRRATQEDPTWADPRRRLEAAEAALRSLGNKARE